MAQSDAEIVERVEAALRVRGQASMLVRTATSLRAGFQETGAGPGARRQLQSGQLPSTGGVNPRIIITIPGQSLIDRTGAGRLNDGYQLPRA